MCLPTPCSQPFQVLLFAEFFLQGFELRAPKPVTKSNTGVDTQIMTGSSEIAEDFCFKIARTLNHEYRLWSQKSPQNHVRTFAPPTDPMYPSIQSGRQVRPLQSTVGCPLWVVFGVESQELESWNPCNSRIPPNISEVETPWFQQIGYHFVCRS